jgi:acetyl-CoA acetyltransferase
MRGIRNVFDDNMIGDQMATDNVYIYEAIRTPRGRGKRGALYSVKPHDLVVGLVDELLRRHPGLDPGRIDDIVLGCVSPVGEQGADIARTVALAAGLPNTVGGVQINRAALPQSFAQLGQLGFDAVALQKYHWVEQINHVHTAGNSSGIVDGAAIVLVGSESAGAAAGLRPRARVVATASSST